EYDFDGIDLCLLNSDATLSVFSALGDPLVGSVGGTGQTVSVTASSGGVLPDGLFQLPQICLNDSEAPETDIEIKWLKDGEVICRDTITVFCKPPCGYLKEASIECDGPFYVWSGDIVNTSMFSIGEAHISFDPADGLSAYDTTIVFTTPLNMGDSESVQILIGAPAMPLDSICFTVTIHELYDDDEHLNCCQFEACIQLPDCRLVDGCFCEDLEAEVDLGFTVTVDPSDNLTYTFSAEGMFQDCDEIFWFVRRVNPNTPWDFGGDLSTVNYTFTSGGAYQVVLYVRRTDENGQRCEAAFGIDLNVAGPAATTLESRVKVYPNPANSDVFVKAPDAKAENGHARLQLYNASGQLARAYSVDLSQQAFGQPLKIDVRGLPPGIYILRGEAEDGAWTTRFIVE
ncbi:MAG: T9SS type A sorting domain-containing protein, partial [Bacteroidota bacterium]